MSGKPIPAIYSVYILRSSVRHASLYIGSTPHPPRRLKQHNGEVQGGANRTSRANLRPWEMVTLVTGFPSMVAALQFEWALNNPHVTTHIPDDSRISKVTSRKKSGQPKRPAKGLASILANIHLLLRVPSFSRWPLKLHFFTQDVFVSWQKKWADADTQPSSRDLEIVTDFGPIAKPGDGVAGPPPAFPGSSQAGRNRKAKEDAWGVYALALDYKPLKQYVTKTKDIFDFERQGHCVVCEDLMTPEAGIYVVCPNESCEGVGHIDCWSNHVLSTSLRRGKAVQEGGNILPMTGTCPSCKGQVEWGHMMKELSLRLRGPDEIEKLLRTRGGKTDAVREEENPATDQSDSE
ncbi:uncharacterized protein MKZ38_001244 [Zalerion maritima]|uniref:GIY-YIG domain-containing protein n=1 Tax=Zalerion maritima TaxID=339359 RepID=A0AAD5RRN0_9PEZI|nr:uncharacterized protein MKZ38_001244 [Zalerion maritima]